ncbi:MAG: choice-of-anchor K domain-containing protein [Nostocaceae cyanobacterium]|nr:choice-of-anchor K domain-containing protein [Nostocaceae cyanobacterium]
MLYFYLGEKFTTAALIISSLLCFSNQAQALTFTGTSSGSWGLPSNPSSSTFLSNENGGINNRLTWGISVANSFTNYVQYDGLDFNTDLNNPFVLGNLSYRNGRTTDFFNGDFPLTVVLSLSNPLGDTQAFRFTFNILNTDNNTGDPVLDGDKLRLSANGLSNQALRFNDTNYTLQLIGFSSDGGISIASEFNGAEETISRASLYARFTSLPHPTPIPEPITVAGLFVIGLYMATRWNVYISKSELAVLQAKHTTGRQQLHGVGIQVGLDYDGYRNR